MSLIEFTKDRNPRTDKYDLGYINEFYAQLFEPKRDQVETVLEIGIQYGYSMSLWRDYFPKATVIGVDVNYCPDMDNQERIVPVYTNAYSEEFVNTIPDNSLDIVIDDGPHTFESMVFFLNNYLNKVKPGGILVLEDIIDRSWTPELLKLIDPSVGKITVHDMRQKQLNQYLYDLWSNGLDVIVVEKN